ncbi:hypothetical protein B0J15DRAFT_462551 [Fusarium solani]|uniref:Uncharacterized protein n=1 Tax=Fusarium solani TaxID=169388 RepID=A0A9P9KU34_FUSSL|nr:uncharacterized protein B0J15DRAFT_462551 [Fusarium solani]KAH7268546.1 hypothetical protein B0J15DRAFT_462551 [Fusarium solani]
MTDSHAGNQSQHSEAERPYHLICLRLADRLATPGLTSEDLSRVSSKAEAMLLEANVAMDEITRACDICYAKQNDIDSLKQFNHNRYEALRAHLQDRFPEGHPKYSEVLIMESLKYEKALCSGSEHLITEDLKLQLKRVEVLRNALNARVCIETCREIKERRNLDKGSTPAQQEEHGEAWLQAEQNHTMSIDELAVEVERYYQHFVQLLEME